MKDNEFNNLVEFCYAGNGFIPVNSIAKELCENCTMGEILTFKEITQRDLKFHRAYMSLLGFIWKYLPKDFQQKVAKDKFYIFCKHLKGQYKVLFSFKDGTKLVEYDSISFGRMSQKRFQEYVKQQLPWIYENIIGAYFEGDTFDSIIETIEIEYQKFLSQL